MQETLPLIKIPPMHDPDAEIAGLTLTVPSWVSSIERARNNADMNAASTSAKSKLEEALLSLQKKVSEMLSEIREVGSQRTRGQKVRERPFAPAFVCAGCYSAEIARHLDAAELTLTPRSAPNVDDPAVFCGYATAISERCVFSRPFSRFIHSFLKSYASTRKKSSVRILAFPLVRKRRKPKSFLSSPNAPRPG